MNSGRPLNLNTQQRFDLVCLRDWLLKLQQAEHQAALSRVTSQGGGATSDDERNYDHWLETLEAILK